MRFEVGQLDPLGRRMHRQGRHKTVLTVQQRHSDCYHTFHELFIIRGISLGTDHFDLGLQGVRVGQRKFGLGIQRDNAEVF